MDYRFGDYTIDTQRFELRRCGTLVKLRPKVFDVLVYLIAHRERIVAKQELLEQLWPQQFVAEATLSSCVRAVRQAVGDTGQAQQVIQTLHRRGFRFVAEIEAHGQERPESAMASSLAMASPLELSCSPVAGGPLAVPEAHVRGDFERAEAAVVEAEHKVVTMLSAGVGDSPS